MPGGPQNASDPGRAALFAKLKNGAYHFTDTRNIPSIREHGLLSLSQLEQRGIKIPAPGGDANSRASDKSKRLHRYVHLSLTPNNPMEYRARQDGRIVESRYLRVSTSVLELPGVLFAPGLVNKAGIETVELEQALREEMIDLDILYTWRAWSLPVFGDRRRVADKYEILVPGGIPSTRILNLPNG